KAEWNNTRLVRDNMLDEVIHLKQQPGKNISLGGISTSQEFMRRGLIDEYWLAVQPVVVGKGKRLFDHLTGIMNPRLVDTKVFKSGVVALLLAKKDSRRNKIGAQRVSAVQRDFIAEAYPSCYHSG